MPNKALNNAPLGKNITFPQQYQPKLLYPIAREINRKELGLDCNQLPFEGVDQWTAYELSWLNSKGKPVVAAAEIVVPCSSAYIIESKSLKLYFNSLNDCRFASTEEAAAIMTQDLSAALQAPVDLRVFDISDAPIKLISHFTGTCLDRLDVVCEQYHTDPHLLKVGTEQVTEQVYSDLFKSNCLVTNQPDWGSILIHYQGKKIMPDSLLRYLVSYRHCNEFAENCIEHIFYDLLKHCQPEKLYVEMRFTRRGGLDINPLRSTYPVSIAHHRLWRQ